jgi:hypothetical protein
MNAIKSRITRKFGQSMALVALLILTGACSTQPSSLPGQGPEQDVPSTPEAGTVEIRPDMQQVSPGNLDEPRKQSDCPGLDSLLLQIVQSSDPLDSAEQLHLNVKEDKVQVLLVLDREDVGFLQDFEVEIGTQSGTEVQAFVPISQLCDLANTDEVLAIRVPAQAVP